MKQAADAEKELMAMKIEITKVRASVLKYIREWLEMNNYLEVSTPVLVKHPLQKDLSFKVNYFDSSAYVSHNNQLYLEKASLSVGKAWTMNPSFRSERQETERHLSEFTLLQLECPKLKDLESVLEIQEQLICHLIDSTIRERIDSFTFLQINSDRLKRIKPPFGRMRYDEAIEILKNKGFQVGRNNRAIAWGDDLDIEAERELTRDITNPLFITHFPGKLRPFYIKRDLGENHLSLSVDMLAPEGFGEITSGGLREDDVQLLKREIRIRYGDENVFSWYCDAKSPNFKPHGGFGLGIERLVRWLTLCHNIKDVLLFPRTSTLIEP